LINNTISGAGIWIDLSNANILSENIISNCYDGIHVKRCEDNIITNNLIHHNKHCGIFIGFLAYNTSVYGNIITCNGDQEIKIHSDSLENEIGDNILNSTNCESTGSNNTEIYYSGDIAGFPYLFGFLGCLFIVVFKLSRLKKRG
jgi:parallel beta-helix repeat protein